MTDYLPPGVPPPRRFDLDLPQWRRALWEASLELRGFVITALVVMHDTMEPISADDNIARMRMGIMDIRVYRRLKAASVKSGFLHKTADGRLFNRDLEETIAEHVAEFEARRKASLAREQRLRSERGGPPASRQQLKHSTRDEIWQKTSGKCVYCGVSLTMISGQSNSYHADHVLPVSRGGTNDMGNLVPSCFTCNAKKSAKTALQFLVGELDE